MKTKKIFSYFFLLLIALSFQQCKAQQPENWTKDQLVHGPIERRSNGQWVSMNFLKHNFMSLTKENIALQFNQKNNFIVKIKN